MKLLCSDYDGTLLINDKISEEDIKAIEAFRNKGNKFAIVTGRTYGVIIDELNDYMLSYDYLICNSGASIVKENTFIKSFVDIDVAKNIAKYFKTSDVMVYGLSNGIDISRYSKAKLDFKLYAKSRREELSEEFILDQGEVCGFYSIFKDKADMMKTAQHLKENFENDIEVLISSDRSIDISPRGVTKSSSINYIGKNNEFKSIYTIGDSLNDLDMIKSFKGFAMASGNQELRKYTLHVVNNLHECIERINNGGIQ